MMSETDINFQSNQINSSNENKHNRYKLTLEPPMLFMFFTVSLTGKSFRFKTTGNIHC